MPFCPRSSVRLERHPAKVEVAGATPAVDAILPLCLRSYRASFVNSYSSVQVRPEAPFHGDHDVTAASRPVTAFVPVRIRLVTPNFDGPKMIGYPHHKEGVPSVAKALAVRVRFPAWSASVRSRHLPIRFRRNGNKTASVICARSLRGLADIPVVQ